MDNVKELLDNRLDTPFDASNEKKRNRKIIFWYDSENEYKEFIESYEHDNTEVLYYDNNSIKIRYHIEREVPEKNIIIYFPNKKPPVEDNPLLDLEVQNEDLIFNPDSTSMLINELGLEYDCRSSIKKNLKFFNNKKRKDAFVAFDVEKNSDNIEKIILAVMLGIKSIKIDDLLKNIVLLYFEDEKKLDEVFKYCDESFIYDTFNQEFGSKISNYEDFDGLFKSLIFTYFVSNIENVNKISKYGNYVLKSKSTNIYVFINNLMRDNRTKNCFEKMSYNINKELEVENLVNSVMDLDEYKYSDAFEFIDNNIIKYITEQLNSNVYSFDLFNKLISIRTSKYWFYKKENEYNFLINVIEFIKQINLIDEINDCDIDLFAKKYSEKLFIIDTLYRKTYYYYDNIGDKDNFMELRQKVENVYVMNYLNKLSIKWSDSISNMTSHNNNSMVLQNNFYNEYVAQFKDKRDRVIVIISDAFRYECAYDLFCRLKKISPKIKLDYMWGLVPSYTKLGMASLLPNKKLERASNNIDILVDGLSSSSISEREKILKNENEDSIAITYKDLYKKTKMDWKNDFSGKKVVYIYHDVIDNAGEHNEDSVFEACDKAIIELEKLVEDLHKTFSGVTTFITADHGFFYKRDKIESFGKTDKILDTFNQKTRFSYSDKQIKEEGIISISLDYIFGPNSGYVNIPKGSLVFSRQGSGINYMHGGLLPQEIIIPVIDFKSNRTSDDENKVKVTYSGISSKITDAVTYLEFFQTEKVDDNHIPCRYLARFEDENGNRISDESTIVANLTTNEVKDRYFREKFVFKNITYDRNKAYFLVLEDEDSNTIISKTKFYIDIPIITDFNL